MKSRIISITALSLLTLSIGLLWWFHPSKPHLKEVSFTQLPGWQTAQLQPSLGAFQASCRVFLRQDPNAMVGTAMIPLQAKDWKSVCLAVKNLAPNSSNAVIKAFFEKWFAPVTFYDKRQLQGLFTGYYLPLLQGSYTQSEAYPVPIYTLPPDLITLDLSQFMSTQNKTLVGRVVNGKMVPFYTRAQISKGAIAKNTSVLFWVPSQVDRLFLEIQGSGIIALEDGKKVYIGYAGQNGFPYTSIAGVLIKKGVMTKDNASMQAIKHYFDTHPKEVESIINQNQSFIFFGKLPIEAALGSQGVGLTPGYSLAVDKQWVPIGLPVWLNTTRPALANPDQNKDFRRLMVAQDTGGAIKGVVRGDVFWGGGDKATLIAGHMKNRGSYWLLVPRDFLPKVVKQQK